MAFGFIALSISVIPNVSFGCPTKDDLSSGIRILYGTGWYTVYLRLDENRIAEVEYTDGHVVFAKNVYTHGVFEVELSDFGRTNGTQNSKYTFSYSFDLSNHVPISEETIVTGTQFETGINGEKWDGFYRVDMGTAINIPIGECSYDGIPIVHTYGQWWDDDHSLGVYFPLIGIYMSTGDVIDFNGEPFISMSISALSD
ncbi:MAG: hypothetical protein ABJM43_14265 [Paracoccaceae bacterium]